MLQRLERKKQNREIFSGEIQASGLFETDPELIEMRCMYNFNFLKLYEEGLNLYLDGYWPEAKLSLEKVPLIKGFDDRPTINLLQFMRLHNFCAPKGWKGHSRIE